MGAALPGVELCQVEEHELCTRAGRCRAACDRDGLWAPLETCVEEKRWDGACEADAQRSLWEPERHKSKEAALLEAGWTGRRTVEKEADGGEGASTTPVQTVTTGSGSRHGSGNTSEAASSFGGDDDRGIDDADCDDLVLGPAPNEPALPVRPKLGPVQLPVSTPRSERSTGSMEMLVDDQAQFHAREEILEDGSKYVGCFRGTERHGWGKFTWATGGGYEGQFLANDMHGEGTYEWGDGSTYTGQWQVNSMGPQGVMRWTDGRTYTGQFQNGQKHGEGELVWPDGRSYTGQWQCGRQHGQGVAVTGSGIPRLSRWEEGKLVRWLDVDED